MAKQFTLKPLSGKARVLARLRMRKAVYAARAKHARTGPKRKAIPFDADTQFIICTEGGEFWRLLTHPRKFIPRQKVIQLVKEKKAVVIDVSHGHEF